MRYLESSLLSSDTSCHPRPPLPSPGLLPSPRPPFPFPSSSPRGLHNLASLPPLTPSSSNGALRRWFLSPDLPQSCHLLLNTFCCASWSLTMNRDAPPGEKPEPVRTHLRNMIIVPEMIGSIVGVYNGKTFNQVEIKPEMIGHYMAEFSISYKPVKHGRPGIGATHSSRFIPLK
ncbi:hypothetical protein ZIOFF_028034 [Zingiber officinale]|uniref:40S ribosomal protein S15 n=1 Tax=Zingiber officinale TaxID=94328 RepID=A0A8J5L9K6_ZINOF|nr:hypothetical protein ZIOFF_028034 [Zingiber officinale]